MSKISLVVNLDTRPGIRNETTEAIQMCNGAVSIDFLLEGVENKKKFLKGFDIETILFIDIHENLSSEETTRILNSADTVVFSKHREYYNKQLFCPKHRDLNYLHALALARGNYIMHFDSDMVAFAKDESIINDWLQMIDSGVYEYISYPSKWSPDAVTDPRYNYRWVSTRFFLCKKDTVNFTEIEKCLLDSEYLYSVYGNDASPRSPWTEHVLGLISYGPRLSTPNKVWYPPINYDSCCIWSWNRYRKGTIAQLNNMSYEEVKHFVVSKGGVSYPVDLGV